MLLVIVNNAHGTGNCFLYYVIDENIFDTWFSFCFHISVVAPEEAVELADRSPIHRRLLTLPPATS